MADVLIVDDDWPVRRMLERTLVAEGYEVEAVGDWGRRWRRSSVRFRTWSSWMSRCRGWTAWWWRSGWRTKGVPVPILFLTARDTVEDRVSGFDAGGDDYLVKPFAMPELLVRMRALLRRGLVVDDMLSVPRRAA